MIFCMTVAEPDPDADAALEDCIARIAGGDKDALADLYNRTRPAVYGFALSIVKNAHDAEDILHDACLQVWNAAGGYRRQGKPMAWVLTITRNLAISRLREHGRTEPLVQEDWQDRLADNPAVTHEDRMMLEAVLSALSDEERQIVTLHALTGLRHREIAALLGLPLPTVLSKIQPGFEKAPTRMEGGRLTWTNVNWNSACGPPWSTPLLIRWTASWPPAARKRELSSLLRLRKRSAAGRPWQWLPPWWSCAVVLSASAAGGEPTPWTPW